MTTACHRARSLVSAGLDGPLNDLEQHFVSAHLGRCDACHAFEQDARAFTTLLRDAPLEPVPWPVTITARGRRSRVQFRTIAQIASVASVVVAAGTIAFASDPLGSRSETFAVPTTREIGAAASEEAIRLLRRSALVSGELQIVPSSETSPRIAARDGSSETRLKPPLPTDVG